MSRLRTVRIDLAPSVYEEAEEHAVDQDIGVTDLIRHILLEWLRAQKSD